MHCQQWVNGGPDGSFSPTLALHGWLDNSGSFYDLAKHLTGLNILAPDLAGHGMSGHRSVDADYTIWSYIDELLLLSDLMNFDQFGLIGHSMGGGVASLMAALFPERIKYLVLLDSIGPMTTSAPESLGQMSKAMQSKIRYRKRLLESPETWQKNHYYKSRELAVAARTKKGISLTAASVLSERGVAENENGFYWQHDKRLVEKSVLSFTDAHVESFFREIHCPVLMVTSRSSLIKKEILHNRIDQLQRVSVLQLEGQHHQHMEEQTVAVANAMNTFLAEL